MLSFDLFIRTISCGTWLHLVIGKQSILKLLQRKTAHPTVGAIKYNINYLYSTVAYSLPNAFGLISLILNTCNHWAEYDKQKRIMGKEGLETNGY